MIEVLDCLAEMGSGETAEIAERVDRSRDYVSLLLGRCKKRGFVEREPYKRGRVRGFTYKLSERGEGWLSYKALAEREASSHSKVSGISRANSGTRKTKRQIVIVESEADHSFLTEMPFSFGFLSGRQATERNALSPVIVSDRLSEEEYYYLADRFERDKKNEVRPLVELLKEKDETIHYLLRYIWELDRRSKSPIYTSSLKLLEKTEVRLSSLKKLNFRQPQPAKRISLNEFVWALFTEAFALRCWQSAMDRWWNWLPEPPSGCMGDILECALKNAHDEMTGKKKPKKSSKFFDGQCEVPREILRLPD